VNRRTEETVRLLRLRRSLGIRPPRRRIPRQVFPKTIEREYAAALLRIIDELRRALQPLRDALPQLVESAARERQDAGEGSRVRQLIADAAAAMGRAFSVQAVEALAATFAQRTSTYQRIQLERQVHAALGANVFASEPNLRPQIDGFVAENVSLITALPQRTLAEIEQAATRALMNATLHKNLAAEIEDRLGVAEEKAKLIARDQVGKLYGQVNATRQQALGVERFIWRTVEDERVRTRHRLINGKTYKYPKGHPTEGVPGQPINCRCYADPVFDDVLDAAESE
jgi:SPP1 gp7 family putative phage head morphogenesis protein